MSISERAIEVRIKALLLSAAMTGLAEEEFRNGNLENAEALLKTARMVLVTAVEIGISISPLGRAKDIIECSAGYSIIPSFRKLEDLDRIFACLGAVGLDRKVIELVTAGVNKLSIFHRIVDSTSKLRATVSWASIFGSNGGAITNRGKRAYAERTQPTLPKEGKPRGTYEKPDPKYPRPIIRQNESADLLAKEGYDVELLRSIDGGNGFGISKAANPDLKINGRIFDVYAPNSNNTRNIWKNVKDKTEIQARRIVLNIDDSSVDINELIKQFNDWPLETLDEIIVIRQGRLVHWFPF